MLVNLNLFVSYVILLILNVQEIFSQNYLINNNNNNELFGLIPPNNKTYFILASKTVRPGQVYRLVATFFQVEKVHIRTSIKKSNVELVSVSQDVYNELPVSLLLKMPSTALPGDYKLRVEISSKDIMKGMKVVNETSLTFLQRSMTIFITTDRPIYKQGQIVKFRCVPITTSLRSFSDSLDIFMRDPNGYLIKRWLSRQTNLGAVTLEYPLSEQPVYGKWKIEVIAQNQNETKEFLVEEFYPTRFEVNVSMPNYFRNHETFIYGNVVANFTSRIPVIGNCTLFIYLEPLHYETKNLLDQYLFKKEFKFFPGSMNFNLSLNEIKSYVGSNTLENTKLIVKALVGERFLNILYSGHASTLILSSQLKLKFIGSSPRVFKPHMPTKIYCALVYQDETTPDFNKLNNKNLTVTFRVFNILRPETYSPFNLTFSQQFEGVWEILINLREYMTTIDKLNDVKALRIDTTYFIEESSSLIKSSLNLLTAFTSNKRFIQIDTSTLNPKVGEYIIFHVRSNYEIDLFYYIIVSKGIVLHNDYKKMTSDSKTISVVLSSEMVPISSIIVYYLSHDGHVISDSLTFHVDGISRNNFSVDLNQKKDKLGNTIEVIVKGEPGTYVGLSALDHQLSLLDTESYFNYNYVLKKMGTFEETSSDIFTHEWVSNKGIVIKFKNFPSFSLGIDSNRTFENAGLYVFTDGIVVKRPEFCNETLGQISCLNGNGCYDKNKRCNKNFDCADGSDESDCFDDSLKKLLNFNIKKNSRTSKVYENSWLWKDINIGSLGYYIFNVSVPDIPTTWIINSFGMNNKNGFGIIKKPIVFSSVKRFLMNIEVPSICIIGEQLGVRVNLFNYMSDEIEVLVILLKSFDYKFVHVEENGYVSTYSPRTSFGEHHHLVLIKPGKTLIVYMPIVPQKLGKIEVCIIAKTQASRHKKCKNILVEADGIPQFLHTSVVIDLSQGAQLIKYLDTNITDTPIIPFQRERRYVFGSNKVSVSVVGDVVGAAFPIIPMDTKNLLRKADAAAEQNMFNFAYNLNMLLYMRSIDQRDYEIEKKSFKYLNIMYQKQISYQNKDGSFRMFRWDNTPSIWLTAFCARILHKATFQEWENYIYIDKSIIERAVSWILKHQTMEGSFYEPYIQPYDRKIELNYNTDPYYSYRVTQNISLTAHVVIALAQIRDLSGEIGSKVATSRYIGSKYLESVLNMLTDDNNLYDLAIVTYALSLVNSVSSEDGFNMLEKKVREVRGMRYWSKTPVDPPKAHSENNRPYLLPRDLAEFDALNIETTAYVLHVYLRKQASNAQDIVDWLNTYRLHDNGWCSTQDSLIALEALIEYSVKSRLRDVINIDVNIEAPSSTNFSKNLKINQNNIVKLNKFQIPKAYGPVIVKVSGSGLALLQLDIQYNVDWAHLQIQPPVPSFNIEVLIKSYGRNASHIQFESCQSWTNLRESRRSGMAVLDITIPTGYLIQQQDLDEQILSRIVPNLREAKYFERKIQFYFDYLDHNKVCLKFTVQRWHPVANLTRYIYARVYDYYAPERFNETMINAYNLYVLSICHVCGSYQCPYCPTYSGSSILKPNLFVFLILIFMLKKRL